METCPMSNNQPKTFCPLLQPLQSENKTHPLPGPDTSSDAWFARCTKEGVYWSRRRRRRSWVSHSVGSGRVESGTIQADTQSPQAHRQGSTFDQSDHWSPYYTRAHLNAHSIMLWADILSDRKQYDLSVNLKVIFFSKYSFSSIFQNRWFVQMRDQEIQPVTITVNSKSMLRFGLHVSINRCRYRLQLLHEDWGSIAWWQSKNQVLDTSHVWGMKM